MEYIRVYKSGTAYMYTISLASMYSSHLYGISYIV
jgi:hypothetical protein